jgi:tetratricopeptide (TPR) repeat protein
MPDTELDELRARSEELRTRLDDPEAVEVNEALLDLDPGDPVTTNRLGIGLLRTGRIEQARDVLEAGLRLHPDNAIMAGRRDEALRALDDPARATAARKRTCGRGAAVHGWTDFEPEELVESALAGPGRDACLRLCAASVLASEHIDATRTAVTPIKTGRRFRTIGGIFTGVGPWKDLLTVAVPVARRSVIEAVAATGGRTEDRANAVPCIQVALPRPAVEGLYDALLDAHIEHLRLSLAAGQPTHLNKHHPALRAYIVEQGRLLGA